MKLVFSFLLTLLGIVWAEEAAIPSSFPTERYQPMWERSPFVLPTPEVAVVETGFADDLVLTGYSKIGEAYYVTLQNKKTQQKVIVSPDEAPDGMKVSTVLDNSNLLEVIVVLTKGDNKAEVKFDPNLFASRAPSEGGEAMPPPPIQVSTPVMNQPGQTPGTQVLPRSKFRRQARVIVPVDSTSEDPSSPTPKNPPVSGVIRKK